MSYTALVKRSEVTLSRPVIAQHLLGRYSA
jgi:hypothetical protein